MAARKGFLTAALPAPHLNRRRWCCSAPAWPVLPAQRVAVAKRRRRPERLSRTRPEASLVSEFWKVSQLPGRFEKRSGFFVFACSFFVLLTPTLASSG